MRAVTSSQDGTAIDESSEDQRRAQGGSMTLSHIPPSPRHAAMSRMDTAIWPLTAHIDELDRLCVGEVALTDVADEFGTPTYVIDEADFRHRIQLYRKALPEIRLVHAGKALLTTVVTRWVTEEGAHLGVSSGGELATALVAGLEPSRIVAHGRALTSNELRKAASIGVGRIVVDSPTEVALLALAARRPQSVLVRVTPGIDDHVGRTVERILDQPLLYLAGLHCSIDTHVTDAALFGEAIRQMVPRMAEVRAHHGVILTELKISGGEGIPHVPGDQDVDLEALRLEIDDAVDAACAAERFPRPTIAVEPGRAMSARAGVTLYRVLRVQPRPGGRIIVVVDGSLSGNPWFASEGACYIAAVANRHPVAPTQQMTVVARHCESVDEIACNIMLPEDLRAGDLLAVARTGADYHSMASPYNMVGRPPLVSVKDGRTVELVRRETIADLLSRDRAYS